MGPLHYFETSGIDCPLSQRHIPEERDPLYGQGHKASGSITRDARLTLVYLTSLILLP